MIIAQPDSTHTRCARGCQGCGLEIKPGRAGVPLPGLQGCRRNLLYAPVGAILGQEEILDADLGGA